MNIPLDGSSPDEKSNVSRRSILLASGAAAAGVAGQKIGEAPAIATHSGVVVSHGHSVGFNWHVHKETPDGSKVLYVRFPGGNPGSGFASAQIWYASPTGTGRTLLLDSVRASNHVGACQQWIDNQRYVYRHEDSSGTRFVRVMHTDGSTVRTFNSLPHATPLQLKSGELTVSRRGNGILSDVWIVNPSTGAQSKVLDVSAFTPWQNVLGGSGPQDWSIWHAYFNTPSKNLIWAKVESPGQPDQGFTFNRSGGDIVRWVAADGRSPGGHPTWWDDTHIWHPANSKIYNRDGSIWKPAQAGTINHGALSPDRNLLAGEVGGNPRKLRLFQAGNTTPVHKLYETSHTGIIDNGKAHPNPAFTRDGTKLYVVKPVSASETRLMMYDVSQWA